MTHYTTNTDTNTGIKAHEYESQPTQPTQPADKHASELTYTTGELAKQCGVTVRTVQFYDTKGLLKPSALTDGGRRLYSKDDLQRLRIICFLKDLGFSLANIADLLNDENPQSMLCFLVQEQEQALTEQIEADQARLERLYELKNGLEYLSVLNPTSFGVIATIMESRKKFKTMLIWMLVIGILMDIAWIGGLVYGILSSIWWPFAIGLIFTIAAGIGITWYYYSHTAYICPEDKTIFRPPFKKVFFAAHTPRHGEMRKLTCPTCGYKGYCLGVYAPNTKPHRVGKALVWPNEGTTQSEKSDGRDA